jgi:hypothetical protein
LHDHKHGQASEDHKTNENFQHVISPKSVKSPPPGRA